MKNFTSDKQKIGELGEGVACKHLENKGFTIKDRNYTKKWGEIDIVAEKEGTLYFIEVKSSKTGSSFNPAENLTKWKMDRLRRVISGYLIHERIGNTPWHFWLMLVFLNTENRTAKVEVMENIIL